jgi:hypothetical protein
MTNKLKTRQWALISDGAELGKSTFIASNARPPLLVIDTDGRFGAVEALAAGKVFYLDQVLDPRLILEDTMNLHLKEKLGTISFDSLTKLYSFHARHAYMQNLDGISKNKAAAMVRKSNAMTVARDLAILGTDIFYSWHTTAGISGKGEAETRDMISEVERSRLATSINVTLQFIRVEGLYGIKVVGARDFGGRPANVGFALFDPPGNYHRGMADKIERLLYTAFTGKPEAVKWAARELEIEIDEAEGMYEYEKENVKPKSPSDMWVAWVQKIDSLVAERAQSAGAELEKEDSPEETKKEEEIEIGSTEEESALPPEDTIDENFIAETKAGLSKHENLSVGHVVFAVAEARADFYNSAEGALKKLSEYPEGFPEKFEAKMDQRLSPEGGGKLYDWLVGLATEAQIEDEETEDEETEEEEETLDF